MAVVTIVVEDGTGLSTSNSYTDRAYARTVLDATWEALSSTVKDEHLIAATRYIDARWGFLLKAEPLLETQSLEFPRLNLYDRYGKLIVGIPKQLKDATCFYAKQSSLGNLVLTPSAGELGKLKKKKTVVGPITTEVEFESGGTSSTWAKFALADKLMKQFTAGGGRGGVTRN